MFYSASAFDQDIGDWAVDSVENMEQMFYSASSFNQDIGGWAVHNVRSMYQMFHGALAFDQDISGWAVDSVTTMDYMFFSASAFDQDLGWCVNDGVGLGWAFSGTPCESTSCGVTRKNEFDECEAIVDDDAFDFGGARRFAASKSSDECGPAAARTSAAVSAESSRGRRVWLTGLRAVRSTAKEPFHCFRSRVGGKVVGIVSCCLGRHSVHS